MINDKSVENKITELPCHRSEPLPGEIYNGTAPWLVETFLILAESADNEGTKHSYLQAAEFYGKVIKGYSAALKEICCCAPKKPPLVSPR
jgi:hypothetical protein